LIYTLNKTPPIFTGRKLRPSGIGIETTVSDNCPIPTGQNNTALATG